MSKKLVTEYNNFNLDEILALSEWALKEIDKNSCDTWEEYADRVLHINPETIEKHPTIKRFREIWGVAFSENMTGKMETVTALSTCCLVNPYCIARMQDGDKVCAHCFAVGTEMRYSALRENTIKNFIVLNSVVIPSEYWPDIQNDMLRGEAVGDVYTWKQHANMFECARANKQADAALWSKNPGVTRETIKHGYTKPENMNYVYSSEKVNKPREIEELLKKFEFIDKIFTVFDAEFIKEHLIDINCGARSCRGCKGCYEKNGIVYMNEKLK